MKALHWIQRAETLRNARLRQRTKQSFPGWREEKAKRKGTKCINNLHRCKTDSVKVSREPGNLQELEASLRTTLAHPSSSHHAAGNGGSQTTRRQRHAIAARCKPDIAARLWIPELSESRMGVTDTGPASLHHRAITPCLPAAARGGETSLLAPSLHAPLFSLLDFKV